MAVSETSHSQNPATPHSTRAFPGDILDLEVLRAFEKVKSDDESDIVVELIDLYLQSSSQGISAMRKAAEEEEWAVFERAAHTLKGSSSTLGLRQVAKICQDLEEESSNPSETVLRLMRLLESKFLEAKSVLIKERNRRQMLAQRPRSRSIFMKE